MAKCPLLQAQGCYKEECAWYDGYSSKCCVKVMATAIKFLKPPKKKESSQSEPEDDSFRF